LIPVHQTRFGDKTGNCFQAAVATLLSLNLDDVPDFCQAGDDKWFDDFQEWLSRRGMCATIVQCESDDEFRMIAPNGACLVGGTSPRGFDHAAVYLDDKGPGTGRGIPAAIREKIEEALKAAGNTIPGELGLPGSTSQPQTPTATV